MNQNIPPQNIIGPIVHSSTVLIANATSITQSATRVRNRNVKASGLFTLEHQLQQCFSAISCGGSGIDLLIEVLNGKA